MEIEHDDKFEHYKKRIMSFISSSLPFLGFALLLFVVPYVINSIFKGCLSDIPFINELLTTNPNLENSHWLGFWGSYLGALIGAIPAYLALQQSKKLAKEQHEQVQKQLLQSRHQSNSARWEMLESRRCSLLPVVDLTLLPLAKWPSPDDTHNFVTFIMDTTGNKKSHPIPSKAPKIYSDAPTAVCSFTVTNIGVGPALNTKIFDDNGTIFYQGDISTKEGVSELFALSTQTLQSLPKTINFTIQFNDVFSNLYERKCTATWNSSQHFSSADLAELRLIKRNKSQI